MNHQTFLLDIMMPDMNGFEVCKVLKSNQHTAHIPVIFVTALAHEQDESEGFALGAVDYITKPIALQLCVRMIHTYHLFKLNNFN